MEMTTDRLILRHWQESDAADLFKYAQDPRIGYMAGFPAHTCVEESLDIIRRILSNPGLYAVCLKTDKLPIGCIGMHPTKQKLCKIGKEIEIAFWLGVPFWGQAIIPEAIRRFQKHIFEDLGFEAIWCSYCEGNENSKRCMEKCGFVYHHTEENTPYIFLHENRTEHFTRLTKDEWLKL
ncbi:MAG: GNAT family N-acetyltransferase [bacterium]|nr:GNAT family N-acetyltransferase [bacterium]